MSLKQLALIHTWYHNVTQRELKWFLVIGFSFPCKIFICLWEKKRCDLQTEQKTCNSSLQPWLLENATAKIISNLDCFLWVKGTLHLFTTLGSQRGGLGGWRAHKLQDCDTHEDRAWGSCPDPGLWVGLGDLCKCMNAEFLVRDKILVLEAF